MNKLKISFGVIIATRNIFNFELAVEERKRLWQSLHKRDPKMLSLLSWKPQPAMWNETKMPLNVSDISGRGNRNLFGMELI